MWRVIMCHLQIFPPKYSQMQPTLGIMTNAQNKLVNRYLFGIPLKQPVLEPHEQAQIAHILWGAYQAPTLAAFCSSLHFRTKHITCHKRDQMDLEYPKIWKSQKLFCIPKTFTHNTKHASMRTEEKSAQLLKQTEVWNIKTQTKINLQTIKTEWKVIHWSIE